MRILIIGGFLGSGKTSLLRGLASYVVGGAGTDGSADPSRPKVVILENEIGEVGIDDKIVSASGLDVRNLFAGCVCCSLAGELVSTLIQLERDFSPELVIVEATGVACPSQIRETVLGAMPGEDVRICTIVDAKRWDRLRKAIPNLIETQLLDADAFLVNKIDLVEDGVAGRVAEEVREFAPDALHFEVSAAKGVDDAVWRGVLGYE